ncbi:MAG TPA: polysaccharide biosynthesis C-terminal domain-containing protein, partial [Actinomycetota bacterium]|nr:polysaccharide biosynthesis C-terminal domain-containing protein [Actinomycetota bacterium]
PSFGAARREVAGVTGYAVLAHAGNVADLATFRIDTLVLAGWWGARELGIYAAAVNVAEVVLYLPSAVATVLLPHRSANEPVPPAVLVRTLGLVTAAAAGVAAAGVAAAPWVVDLLYPAGFERAVGPLRVLFVAMVGTSVRRVLAAELAAVGRQGAASVVAVVTLVAIVALDLLLIPEHGADGAAWASAAAYLLGGALIGVVVTRRRPL